MRRAFLVAVVALWCMGAGERQVNLLATGDSGTGDAKQAAVAEAMATYAAGLKGGFDAAVVVGDNICIPLESVTDPKWQTLFEKMYDPQRLNFPFYTVLGNHDYEGRKAELELEYARVNPQSRWKMPAKWFRVDFPKDRPVVTVIFVDSDQGKLSKADWQKQKQWMDEQLAGVGAGVWKMVVAHHPPFSNGAHGDVVPLREEWGEILKNRKVDFYVCGHEHDLEHLEVEGWPTSFMLVGGGGRGVRAITREDHGPFARAVYGFAHMKFTEESVEVRYMGVDGKVVHAFGRDREGKVTVTETSKDKPREKKPKKVNDSGTGEK